MTVPTVMLFMILFLSLESLTQFSWFCVKALLYSLVLRLELISFPQNLHVQFVSH